LRRGEEGRAGSQSIASEGVFFKSHSLDYDSTGKQKFGEVGREREILWRSGGCYEKESVGERR